MNDEKFNHSPIQIQQVNQLRRRMTLQNTKLKILIKFMPSFFYCCIYVTRSWIINCESMMNPPLPPPPPPPARPIMERFVVSMLIYDRLFRLNCRGFFRILYIDSTRSLLSQLTSSCTEQHSASFHDPRQLYGDSTISKLDRIRAGLIEKPIRLIQSA